MCSRIVYIIACLLLCSCELADPSHDGSLMQDFDGSFTRMFGSHLLRYDVSWTLDDNDTLSVWDVSVVITNLADSSVEINYPSSALGVLLWRNENDIKPSWHSRSRINPGTGRRIAWAAIMKNKELGPGGSFSPPEFNESYAVRHLLELDSLAEGAYDVKVALDLYHHDIVRDEKTFDADSILIRR